jgi:glycosyltransferase involved in cell wall biosynthesis
MDWMNRRLLRRAHTIIALDEPMARRLKAKSNDNGHVVVIPPWGAVTADSFSPLSVGKKFRAAHGLEDKFVVMYSGNHSFVHPLDTIIETARRMREDERFVFVFVGGGHGKEIVEKAGLSNVRSVTYQSREALADSLGAANLHVVTMGDAMLGIVHPSKIYGILAAQRPVLYVGPLNSHVDIIVREHDLGWSVRHGDADNAVRAVLAAIRLTPDERNAIAARARALAVGELSPDVLSRRVANRIQRAMSDGASVAKCRAIAR